MSQDAALGGLRVLDLSTLYAAPQLGALLADFGADVVKVEPPDGDPLTGLGARRAGRSLPYVLANRGKRRVILDPATREGAVDLGRLVDVADVVVANQPPKVLERWCCSPSEILSRNPQAVVATVSCYGSSGPLGGEAGNGTLAEAFGGLTHLTGEADAAPVLPSVALGDVIVAVAGAVAVLAACWHRDATGGAGQHVDVAMFEPVIHLVGSAVAGWQVGDSPPVRNGSRVEGGAPRNVYQGADGRFLVVSGTTDSQVERVMAVLGRATPEDRARFARSEDRLAHADELDELVASWIAERPRDEALALLAEARVPVAPVHDLAELVAHPQVGARGSVATVEDPVAGPVSLPGPLARLSHTPGDVRAAPVEATSLEEVRVGWSSSGPRRTDRPAESPSASV